MTSLGYATLREPPKMREMKAELEELADSKKEMEKGNFGAAIAPLQRADQILAPIFGENNQEIQLIRSNLAFCLLKNNKYSSASKLLEQMYEKQAKEIPSEQISFFLDNLIFCNERQNNFSRNFHSFFSKKRYNLIFFSHLVAIKYAKEKIERKMYIKNNENELSDEIETLLDLANYYFLEKELSKFSETLKICEQKASKVKNEFARLIAQKKVGDLVLISGEKQRAEEIYCKALEEFTRILEKRGIISKEEKETNKTLGEEASHVVKEMSDLLNKQAENLISERNFEGASEKLELGLKILYKLRNVENVDMISTLILYARLYVLQKNRMFSEGVFNKLESLADQNLQLAREDIKRKRQFEWIYSSFAELLRSQDKPQEAQLLEEKLQKLQTSF